VQRQRSAGDHLVLSGILTEHQQPGTSVQSPVVEELISIHCGNL
jgi:hypothetical protein